MPPSPEEIARLVDRRDAEYVAREDDPARREAVYCTVAAYRHPDRLAVGDPVPALEIRRLDGSGALDLAQPGGPPLVLVFGSYT